MRTTKHQPRALGAELLLPLGLVVAAAVLARAEVAAEEATFNGTWRHVDVDAGREQRHRAIDRATEGVGALMRGGARSRLRDTTEPAPDMTIEDGGARVTLITKERRLTVLTDGSSTPISADAGEGTAQATRREGQLVLTIRREDATRTTVYRLSPDGARLTLEVSLRSARLSGPLLYSIDYARR